MICSQVVGLQQAPCPLTNSVCRRFVLNAAKAPPEIDLFSAISDSHVDSTADHFVAET